MTALEKARQANETATGESLERPVMAECGPSAILAAQAFHLQRRTVSADSYMLRRYWPPTSYKAFEICPSEQ